MAATVVRNWETMMYTCHNLVDVTLLKKLKKEDRNKERRVVVTMRIYYRVSCGLELTDNFRN